MTCEHQITKQKTCKQNNKQKRMNEYTNDNETEKKNDTHTHTMTIKQNKHESFKKLISFTAPHCTVRKEQNRTKNII